MTPRTEASPSWKYYLTIIFAVAAVYGQTLDFDFVNYDDYDLILNNENYLSDPANIATSFTTHAFVSRKTEGVYYRPILLISFITDYSIWKLNPLGYHLTNVLLHSLAAVIVFSLVRLLVKEKTTALLASLLFALHPVQVESVAWIAGRNDVLLGIFIFLMVLFYIKHHEDARRKKSFFILSLISFTLALFTKESAAFFILLLPLYDLGVMKRPFLSLLSKPAVMKYLPFTALLIIYLIIRLLIFGEITGTEKMYGMVSLPGRIRLIPAIVMEQMKLLLLPIRLSIEHPIDQIIWTETPWVFIALSAILLVAFLSWKYMGGSPFFNFGSLWIVIGLVPTLNIFPMAVPILEHRLYAVSAGFVLALSAGIRHKMNNRYRFGTIIFAILIILAATASFRRVPVWRDSERLWTDAIVKAPSAHRSYYNLAGYYFDRRRYDRSIELLKTYIRLKPEDFTGYSKLRQTYFLAGEYQNAVSVCRQMISIQPLEQNRYIDLGLLFERINLPDSAIRVYLEGLSVDSGFYSLHFHLGKMYQLSGDLKKAEEFYRRAIRLKPDYAAPYFNLGVLEAERGNDTLALRLLEEGSRFSSPSPDIGGLLTHLRNKIYRR